MTTLRCPECGHTLHGLERMVAGLRAELDELRRRREREAAYRRWRYATDPEYRERQKARTRRWKDRQRTTAPASSTRSTAAAPAPDKAA